jgi:hypothetical protein
VTKGTGIPRRTGLGCGLGAALGFLVLIGSPVLFVYSFGMSPCEDGPCNPDGARDFTVVAVVLLICAAVVFAAVRHIVRARRRSRHDEPA